MKLNANDFDHYQSHFTRNFDHFGLQSLGNLYLPLDANQMA